jgi:uncharacterized protein (TIGR03000 family)
MYGPPVPTGKPVPGMFGGGDSRFFAPPPLYPGWLYGVYIPLNQPATLPQGVWETFPSAGLPTPANELPAPAEVGPPPAPILENPSTLEIEVRLPREDARLFIDGQPTKSSGAIRKFATPAQTRIEMLTYDIRAEWVVDGLTTTHTKRVTGQPGEHVVVEFK